MNNDRWRPTYTVLWNTIGLSLVVHLIVFMLNVSIVDETPQIPITLTVNIEYNTESKSIKEVAVIEKLPEKIVTAHKKVSLKPKKLTVVKQTIKSSVATHILPPVNQLIKQAALFASQNINQNHVLIDTSKNSGIYENYIHSWRSKIKNVGEKFFSNGEHGQLVIIAKIRKDGALLSVKVIQKSSVAQLNKDALNMVRLGAPYAKFPSSFNGINTLSIRTVIAFGGP